MSLDGKGGFDPDASLETVSAAVYRLSSPLVALTPQYPPGDTGALKAVDELVAHVAALHRHLSGGGRLPRAWSGLGRPGPGPVEATISRSDGDLHIAVGPVGEWFPTDDQGHCLRLAVAAMVEMFVREAA